MLAYFFDMDGVLFNSMPLHAIAWEEAMQKNGLPFTQREVFLNEGRSGRAVIDECYRNLYGQPAPEQLCQQIYQQKSLAFQRLGTPAPIDGIKEVLQHIHSQPDRQIWIVTGSAEESLFQRLNICFPGIFSRERMITANDVKNCKPAPDPYLTAWERSSLPKQDCCVIENAPLGVRAAKAAGLFCCAVNTGILTLDDLAREQADIVFRDMHELLTFFCVQDYIESDILPRYEHFDGGHRTDHARAVISGSLRLVRELRLYAAADGDTVRGFPCPVSGTRAALLAYVIAACHDIGLAVDREHHHLHSGSMIRSDEKLRQWFSESEIELMACAAEDHRASAKQPPRTVYGAIVAEADRNLDTSTVIRRALLFGLKHNPELGDEEQCRRAAQHLQEKYSEEGYLHLWLNSERNVRQQQQLQSLISDPARLLDTTRQLLAEIKKSPNIQISKSPKETL